MRNWIVVVAVVLGATACLTTRRAGPSPAPEATTPAPEASQSELNTDAGGSSGKPKPKASDLSTPVAR